MFLQKQYIRVMCLDYRNFYIMDQKQSRHVCYVVINDNNAKCKRRHKPRASLTSPLRFFEITTGLAGGKTFIYTGIANEYLRNSERQVLTVMLVDLQYLFFFINFISAIEVLLCGNRNL